MRQMNLIAIYKQHAETFASWRRITIRRVFAKGPTLAEKDWLKKVSTADIVMESRKG